MAHACIDRSSAAVECIKKEVETLAGISCHHSLSTETRLQVVQGKRLIVNAHLDDIAKAIRGDAGPDVPSMPNSILPAEPKTGDKVMVYFDTSDRENAGWLAELQSGIAASQLMGFEKLITCGKYYDNTDIAFQAASERRELIAKALGKTVEDIADQYQFFLVRVMA